jgi:hypothetical protein
MLHQLPCPSDCSLAITTAPLDARLQLNKRHIQIDIVSVCFYLLEKKSRSEIKHILVWV